MGWGVQVGPGVVGLLKGGGLVPKVPRGRGAASHDAQVEGVALVSGAMCGRALFILSYICVGTVA